ncbi:MAG: hypothetical protein LUF78_01840 [Clostridiales bacterium]|nr:hypothetical protein [Clostridiales bacterium]
MNCYNSILRFGNRVVFTAMNYKGETLAGIYGFAEEPHEGFGRIECRIRLVELANAVFEDTLIASFPRPEPAENFLKKAAYR